MVHNDVPHKSDIIEETDYFDDVDQFKAKNSQEVDAILTADHNVKDKLIFSVSC